MRKWMAMLLMVLLMLPATVLAQGAVLLVELEQDAQLVEHVAFDDGDYLTTYQMGGGAQVQLLRYASFDMTLGDLFASEWVGATDVHEIGINEIGGYAAQGLRFAYQEAGQQALDVTLIVVNAPQTLRRADRRLRAGDDSVHDREQ